MADRTFAVRVKGEGDFSEASRSLRDEAARMERIASAAADEIRDEFEQITDGISLDVDLGALDRADERFADFRRQLDDQLDTDVEVDVTQLREAFDLAERLDRQTASIDLNTDPTELRQLEQLAASLRSFTGRLGLDVDGRRELQELLGLAENLDEIRNVRVQVRGREDLERAARLADDLDGTKRVTVEARADGLDDIGADLGAAGRSGGQAAADGIADALGNVDLASFGGALVGQLGALGTRAGPIAGIGIAAGLLFSDEIATGIDRGFNAERNAILAEIRTGLGPAALAPIGVAAGEAYADGFGDSLGEVRDTAALLEVELRDLDPSLDLGQATAEAEAFAEVWGVEVPDQIRLTQRLLANDLVDSHDEAMDLLVDAAQRYPLSFRENFEVLEEFSSVLGKLGIDAGTAFEIAGEGARQGLFPNLDRTLELFEEFNIEVATAGRAVEPIESLGLSFEGIQNQLARGDGAEALTDVVDALLALEDPARRDALAVEIFGTALESAGDVAASLELLSTADQVREVGDASGESTARLEESRTALDRFRRDVEEFSANIGAGLSTSLDAFFGDSSQRSSAFDDIASDARQAAIDLGALIGVTEETTVAEDVLGVAARAAADATLELGDDAEDASAGVGELRSEVVDLDVALEEFAGRFDADSVFRSIDDDVRGLADAMGDLEGASFSAATGFDTTSEAGSRAEAAAERLSENLDDLVRLYDEGRVSAEQFASGQTSIEAALRSIGAQAGLQGNALDEFVRRYGAIDGSVATALLRVDNQATGVIASVRRQLDALARNRNITLTANSFVSASGRVRRAATGDVADTPRLRIIGDNPGARNDPELVAPRSQLEDAVRTVLREETGARAGAGQFIETLNLTAMLQPGEDVLDTVLVAAAGAPTI